MAPLIVQVLNAYLLHVVKPQLPKDALTDGKKVVILGMEAAGGMLACQLASANEPKINSWCDFLYIRKKKIRLSARIK